MQIYFRRDHYTSGKIIAIVLGTGQKLEGGRAGANMGRAMVFHASSKGRVKQFGACH